MRRRAAGYTLLELLLVIGIAATMAAVAWPHAAHALARAQLTTAAQALLNDVRTAARLAKTEGRMVTIEIDPRDGSYAWMTARGERRVSRLPQSLRFGSPEDPRIDGVTFRDNTIRLSPRAGLQHSFGSVTICAAGGQAARLTMTISGHTSLAQWDGSGWY